MLKRVALLVVIGSLVACETGIEPETKSQATQFPLRANWNAAVTPMGSATVRATVTIKEYLGSRMEATAALTGGQTNTAYQWRIFRGDCSTTAVAANASAPTGLLLFATIQSYPDITAVSGGSGTVTRTIAGALDSLTAYSLRIRVATTATNWNGTNPIACGNLQRTQ